MWNMRAVGDGTITMSSAVGQGQGNAYACRDALGPASRLAVSRINRLHLCQLNSAIASKIQGLLVTHEIHRLTSSPSIVEPVGCAQAMMRYDCLQWRCAGGCTRVAVSYVPECSVRHAKTQHWASVNVNVCRCSIAAGGI